MKIKIIDKEKAETEVCKRIIKLVKNKPKCVLGLATGSTPIGIYGKIVDAYDKGKISFKNVTTFNLDEYVNIDENNFQSYRYFMNSYLFSGIDINKNNTYFPSEKLNECNYKNYDNLIAKKGGIDFQILGIGSNGHIAFNEPGSSFDSKTRIVDLSDNTIKDNSRFFDSINDVPKQAISMGLSSIMQAKEIVLLAFGKNKAKAVLSLVKGEKTTELPASILQGHNNVTIYCDKDAGSLLKNFN